MSGDVQAAAEGMTIVFSSGDDGDVAAARCDRLAALGDVPRSLYGPVQDQWRRHMAPGKGDQVRR